MAELTFDTGEITAALRDNLEGWSPSLEAETMGYVLSVGDGRLLPDGTRAKHPVSEGDRVLFSSYAGTQVEVDGEELLIMSDDEILAILP